MKAARKSTGHSDPRPLKQDAKAIARRRETGRLLSAARELSTYSTQSAANANGPLAKLRAAGWVPADLAIDEAARRAIEWTDAEGRRVTLRPYAAHLWAVRRYFLPHEREAERQRRLEVRRQWDAQWAETQEARKRERLTVRADFTSYPGSAGEFRDMATKFALGTGDLIENYLSGGYLPGCHIDEDSLDAVRVALASIQATLAAATWHRDPRGGDRLRAAYEARHDEQLQTWLRGIAAGGGEAGTDDDEAG